MKNYQENCRFNFEWNDEWNETLIKQSNEMAVGELSQLKLMEIEWKLDNDNLCWFQAMHKIEPQKEKETQVTW